MNEGVTIHHQLLLTGTLPWWLSLVVVAAIGVAALALLRGEIRARSRAVRAVALMSVRVAIVVLLVLLICQPVLVTRREERRAAAVKIVADRSRSMLRVDASTIPDRVRLASTLRLEGIDSAKRPVAELVHVLRSLGPHIVKAQRALTELADDAAQGLPSSTATKSAIADSRRELASSAETVGRLVALVSRAEKETTPTPATRPATTQPTTAPAESTASIYELPESLGTLAMSLGDEKALAGEDAARKSADDCRTASDKISRSFIALDGLQSTLDESWHRAAPEATRKAVDELGTLSRFELARRLAKSIATDPAVAAKHRVELVSLDDLSKANAVPRTDLFDDIARVLAGSNETPPAGLVLLTDGRQTLPDRPELAARLKGRPIALVGCVVGSPTEPLDVAIADASAPLVVPRGKNAVAHVTIKTAIPAGTEITVTLADGDRVLTSQTVKADGRPSLRVPLGFRSSEKFTGPLTVRAALAQPDAIPDNDTAKLSVVLLDRTPRILVVAPSPDWQTIALMRALTLASARVETVFWEATPKDADKEAARSKFPASLATAKRYDAIVMAGRAMPALVDADYAMLHSYVEREGGRLIVVDDGVSGAGYLTRLASLIGPPQSATTQPAADATPIAPPNDALGLPAVSLSLDPYHSLAQWQSLAQPRSLGAAPKQVIPLLTSGDRSAASVGFVGKGRVYGIASSDLWRMGEWDSGGAVNRFFSSVAEESIIATFNGSETLATYPRVPVAGTTARVLVMSPAGVTPKGKLECPNQPAIELAFTAARSSSATTQPAQGAAPMSLFVANVAVPEAPAFTITLDGGAKLEGTILSPVYGEDLGVSADKAALERVVGYAGGECVTADELAQRIAAIPARTDLRVDVTERRLWNAWWLLIALAGLWTVEWVLRRRSGMAL